jgi:phosphoribosylformimino-5-aminoimidazole carboxamide ribotide isomerase
MDYAAQFKDAGVGLIIYSDTQEDGTVGPKNIDNTREYVRQAGVPTIFQADIENLSDIENIMSLETYGLMGIIVGRPIYEGRLDLKSAITFIK